MLKALILTVRNVFLSIQQNLTEEKRQEKIVCVEGEISIKMCPLVTSTYEAHQRQNNYESNAPGSLILNLCILTSPRKEVPSNNFVSAALLHEEDKESG